MGFCKGNQSDANFQVKSSLQHLTPSAPDKYKHYCTPI